MRWLTALWRRRAAHPLSVEERARRLIHAIDQGGVPLSPAVVNDIARGLGLEVSSRDPVERTVARIRQALTRL